MDKFSFLGATHINMIEEMYAKYLSGNIDVDSEWKHFFQGFDFAQKTYENENEISQDDLPKEFNCLVGHYDLKGAKALHYTNGGPWFDDYRDAEASEEWWRVYNSL